MAKINLTEDELNRADVPDGVHPCEIEACEMKVKDDGSTWLNWRFLITQEDDNPKLHGERLFSNTQTDVGKGWMFLRYLKGLGLGVGDFDTDNMVGMPVYCETKTRAKDGRKFTNVEELRTR